MCLWYAPGWSRHLYKGKFKSFLLIFGKFVIEQNLYLKLNAAALIEVTCLQKWQVMGLSPGSKGNGKGYEICNNSVDRCFDGPRV